MIEEKMHHKDKILNVLTCGAITAYDSGVLAD